MSSARGRVHFEDKYVMHGKYHGTSDVFLGMIFPTQAHAQACWESIGFTDCTCGKDEPVVLYSEYGGGFAWKGRACRRCGVVTAENMPYENEETEMVNPGLVGED